MSKASSRGKNEPLRPVDVPQSDSLPTIRAVVAVADKANRSVGAISGIIGVSDRHVRYRLQSARILGLVDRDRVLTARGKALLATAPGSDAERALLAVAMKNSLVVSHLFPNLLTVASVDLESMANAISASTGLSHSTAHRRARVLRSWRRQLKLDGKVKA